MKVLLMIAISLAVVGHLAEAEPQNYKRLLGKALLAKAAFAKGAIIGSALSNNRGFGGGRRRGGHYSGYNRGYNTGYNSGRYSSFGGHGGSYRRGGYSRGYGKRSVDEQENIEAVVPIVNQVEQLFLKASINDADDCLKFFVCEAASKPVQDSFEANVSEMFGSIDERDDTSTTLDVTRGSVEFDLAAVIGRVVGEPQCQTVYARCQRSYNDIKTTLEENTNTDAEQNNF